MIKPKKAKIESLAIHVRPSLLCTYCKRNGHLKEKCYQKLMDEYRMLTDIHKPSSTPAEVSTSDSARGDEENDKARESEWKLKIKLDAPRFEYQIISTKIIPRLLNPNSAGRSFMEALLPPKPISQTNRNCLIYLPLPSKDINMYGTTLITPA